MIEPRPSKVIEDANGFMLIDHHLADRLFESRRPRRVGELAQQLDGAILRRERRGGQGEQ